MTPLLDVRELSVTLGGTRVLDEVSFQVHSGQSVALVGESGAGKSTLALALMRLLPDDAAIRGSIVLDGVSLLELDEPAMCSVRGRVMSLLFQEARAALNPELRVGVQLEDAIQIHASMPRAERKGYTTRLLASVGLSDASKILDAYPDELSTGQCQRALLAMTTAHDPKLIILDEPTSALDPVAEALALQGLRSRLTAGAAVLLITHDLRVARALATQVGVLYAGKLVEWGSADAVLNRPAHPYAQGLLASTKLATRRYRRVDRYPIPTVPLAVGDARSETGCPFSPRCSLRTSACERFPGASGGAEHQVWCHHAFDGAGAHHV